MHGEPAEAPHAGERRRDEHPVVALVAQGPRDESERRAHTQRDVAERCLAARHPANRAGHLHRATRLEALLDARDASGELRGGQRVVQRDHERARPARLDPIAQLRVVTDADRRLQPSLDVEIARRGKHGDVDAARRAASSTAAPNAIQAPPGIRDSSQSGATTATASARRRVGTNATARNARAIRRRRRRSDAHALTRARARARAARPARRPRCAPPPRAPGPD